MSLARTRGMPDRMIAVIERFRVDPYMLAATASLLIVGLMAIYSVVHPRGMDDVFRKQIMWLVIGCLPAALFWQIPLGTWQKISSGLWLLNLGLLAAVIVKGHGAKGALRWIQIGPMQFQPSEMSKILCCITLAAFFANRIQKINEPSTLWLSLLHIFPSLVLIAKQPHLGATLVIFTMWLAVSLAAGVPWKNWLGAVAILILLVGGGFKTGLLKLHGYQSDRLEGLATEDRKGKTFQAYQAQLAFGSGGVLGKGYLKGEQKANVPEQHNDFIFSLIGEEGGMVVCSMVLAAFVALFFRIWLLMVGAQDTFARCCAAGILSVLAFHTVINLAMNLELLPVVGLWLPFMSYGGTALWLCMSCVGLTQNIYRSTKEQIFAGIRGS